MASHVLTATVPSDDDARRAVEALSLHGVDGRRIRVTDPAQTGAPRDRRDDRRTDARVVRRIGGRALRGLVVGAGVGAVLGAVLLAVVVGGPGAMVFGALGGAVAFAGLGALVGLQSTPTMAPAWGEANAPGPGVRRVVVGDVSDEELEDVRRLLVRHARDVRTDA